MIVNKTSMKQMAVLMVCGILTVFSCEEENLSPTSDNVSPNLDEYRISKILNYPNSTADSPGGGIEFSYDQNGNLIGLSFLRRRLISFDTPMR